MDTKCSLSLHTRVKDRRNIFANLANFYDCENNKSYTDTDDKKKCEIFGITKSNIDFITQKTMKGIGDHLYPLCADFKKKNIIGSDSKWNRIPVSGYNSKYKKDKLYIEKINKWIEYVAEKEGVMYYTLKLEHISILQNMETNLIRINSEGFNKLCKVEL